MNQFLSRKSGFDCLAGFLVCALSAVPAYAAQRTSGLWWMPDVASKSGEQIDQLTYFIYYLTGGGLRPDAGCLHLFFDQVPREKRGASHLSSTATIVLNWFGRRYRRRSLSGFGVTAITCGGTSSTRNRRQDTMEIAVTAYQFGFCFSVPGSERQTGAIGRETDQRRQYVRKRSDPIR